MMRRAVAMFSGGLDSILAVRLMQEQGFEVDTFYVQTPFCLGGEHAARMAQTVGARHTTRQVGEDYVDVLCRPQYGYGSAMNPCIDCHIHMAWMAGRFMAELGASMVVSGEVLSQRPMSQRRHHLSLVAMRSGLEGRLLRPLSAQLLPPTLAELSGEVDRDRLQRFSGRSRKPQLELAQRLGVTVVPGSAGGCVLTERSFAPRARDLIQFSTALTLWDFELLRLGRHVRLTDAVKAVYGRDESENTALREFARRGDPDRTLLLEPEDFNGPDALLVGPAAAADAHRPAVAAQMVRYARQVGPGAVVRVRITRGEVVEWLVASG